MGIVAKRKADRIVRPALIVFRAILVRKGLTEIVNVFGKTRFISRGSVPMNDAFVDRFIDQRHCRKEKLNASRFVACRDGGAQLLYRSTQFAAVAAVDLVAFHVLTNAFLCRFMISH